VQVYFDCGAEIAVNTPDQSAALDTAGGRPPGVGTPDQAPSPGRATTWIDCLWYSRRCLARAQSFCGNGGRMRRAFATATIARAVGSGVPRGR
jgi:hypothetical protein